MLSIVLCVRAKILLINSLQSSANQIVFWIVWGKLFDTNDHSDDDDDDDDGKAIELRS